MNSALVWVTVAGTLIVFILHWWMVARYGETDFIANARGLAINVEPKRSPVRPLKHPVIRLGEVMMAFVSVAVLCSSLFIILSGRYDDASQKWAFGSVGSIFGFWCRRK